MARSTLTAEEQYRFDTITKVIKKEIKTGYAAKLLRISPRQVLRLSGKVQTLGEQAVIHGLKGKLGNRQLPSTTKKQALVLIARKYADFKPTFAAEKLEELHHLSVHPQTLRRWMGGAGLWKIHNRKQPDTYHSWRPPKDYFGELEQFDGSYHYWFENRFVDEYGQPIEVCLLASIDDATSKVTKAQFAANEGVVAVFLFWKDYVQTNGKPLSIYLDKFSTYKINHKAAVDNHELLTQFQRAMRDLETKLIPAHSPQAKGRIERLFGTFQDRLVKEMRLAKCTTPEDGNKFLDDFIPKFNKRFANSAAKEGNVHRPLTATDQMNLHRIFSIQSKRKVNNDFTIQFKNHWYQLAELQPITVSARETVIVEEWLDGTIHFSLRKKYLTYTMLPERPKREKKQPIILTKHKLNWKPPKDHPWRKPFKPRS